MSYCVTENSMVILRILNFNQCAMFDLFKTKPKKYTDLVAQDFKKEMTASDAVLIDVRSSGEFQSGKIKGARNINVSESGFNALIQNLPKNKKYYLYCRSGARSAQACSMMAEQCFENVNNLKSGVLNWPFDLV